MPTDEIGPCPCGSGAPYGACCGPLHRGAPAPGAEAVMRSRYCAFVLGDRDHLLRTWHPSTRPTDLTLDPSVRWTRLRVIASEEDGDTGTVEFRAHYRVDGDPHVLHERSRFVRDGDGAWLYLDGERPAGA